ncbi:MAG: hypothetical protein WD623_15780 [Marinobacter sp.]|uniref:hypothetical protein n=1 Tax=Marinobacter sp. TaxID=50741 RepID=UPI0034A0747D
MTIQCPYQWQPSSGRRHGQRNDLLGLAGDHLAKPVSPGKATIKLASLGFAVEQPGPDRWVLSKAGATLRVYLYGHAELSAFANRRALAYACGFDHPDTCQPTLETRHDKPCPVSG